MLMPKKVKFRKWQTGRRNMKNLGRSSRRTVLSFGSFGLKALSSFRLRATQIEAARKAMVHALTKTGKFWIRVFPDRPYTAKPPEVGMGKGKGDPAGFCTGILPGRIIFEIDGVKAEIAREALRKAGTKLPIKTKIISRN